MLRRFIIKAGQMQHAVQGVEKQFILHRKLARARGGLGDGGAKQNLTIGKGNHVSFTRVSQEIGVDSAHIGAADQNKLQAAQPRGKWAR